MRSIVETAYADGYRAGAAAAREDIMRAVEELGDDSIAEAMTRVFNHIVARESRPAMAPEIVAMIGAVTKSFERASAELVAVRAELDSIRRGGCS